MFSRIRQIWASLSAKELLVSTLILILLWGGIAAAILLSRFQIINDPGTFYWGCIAGSFVLAYLAYCKKKQDFVSLLTPVYAIIIFLGLEIQPNLYTQALYAGSLTILLIRLHANFS